MSTPTSSGGEVEWPESRARHVDEDLAHFNPDAEVAGQWANDRLADVGVVWSPGDFDVAAALELEFLTALVWAPVEESRRVVHALVGDRSVRAVSDQPVDAIPLSSALFLSPTHQAVFGAVVELVDAGTPPTPMLLGAHARAYSSSREERHEFRRGLLDVTSPAGRVPVAAELPHLARSLVDAWYRRGYVALTLRMGTVIDHAPPGELSRNWAQLSVHERTATRRREAVRSALDSRQRSRGDPAD